MPKPLNENGMYICDYQDMLKEFQEAIHYKTSNEPWQPKEFYPGDALALLRGKLIIEEAEEAQAALMDETKAAVAKELADILYVVFGTAVEYNIPLFEVFLRVHDNNMMKIRKSTFNEFGKLIKPKNHPSVSLEGIL